MTALTIHPRTRNMLLCQSAITLPQVQVWKWKKRGIWRFFSDMGTALRPPIFVCSSMVSALYLCPDLSSLSQAQLRMTPGPVPCYTTARDPCWDFCHTEGGRTVSGTQPEPLCCTAQLHPFPLNSPVLYSARKCVHGLAVSSVQSCALLWLWNTWPWCGQ